MKVLKKLNDELNKRSVPAQLIEEDSILTVYLSPEEAGHEVYGDIYFRPYSDEKDSGGYYILNWEVMEVSPLSDMKKSEMCNIAAVVNTRLTAGGYGYFVRDDVDDEWLIFRMSISLANSVGEDWLIKELLDSIALSAANIKNTVDCFKDCK